MAKRELPENWITDNADFFRVLLSGHALSFQDSTIPLHDVLDRFQVICCALPKTLQWRLGIRVGAWEMKGEVGLAHGQRAMSGVRLLKTKLRGTDQVDLSRGERYVKFLQEKCSDCKTLNELRKAIDEALPTMSKWDGIQPQQDWTDVAKEIVDRILEKRYALKN